MAIISDPPPRGQEPPKRWLSAREVAALWDCDVETVYAALHGGRLPGRPHGARSWRFDREIVERLGQRTEPAPTPLRPDEITVPARLEDWPPEVWERIGQAATQYGAYLRHQQRARRKAG